MACTGCQILPRPLDSAGVLYVAPPLAHTRTSLRAAVTPRWHAEEPHAGVLGFPVAPGELPQLLGTLAARLSEPELEGCRAVLVPEGTEFGIGHLLDTQPLRALVARGQAGWLGAMIEERRLFSHFQPIVSAREPGEVAAYECLVRGRGEDGATVFPDRLFAVARSADLLFHLDREARLTAIRESEAFGVRVPVFINFNPTSIYDPAFCLRTTIAAARATRRTPADFVFEVVESDDVGDTGHLLRILDTYREAGFRVALDDLGAGYASLNLLSTLRPDFVKFDRELVQGVGGDPYKGAVLGKLLEMAAELGVRTIAEGVETEEEWRWLRDRGVDYVQGYLFARPATPPPLPRVPGALPAAG
ncbi:MAG TPA: EAL domain-containing protein [Longimicrobiaceae bacterium]|jgi:EAL domain-containing protein (putative c-di-GMP-specific phosphodiesterase class I)